MGGCLALIWQLFVDAVIARIVGKVVERLVNKTLPTFFAWLINTLSRLVRLGRK